VESPVKEIKRSWGNWLGTFLCAAGAIVSFNLAYAFTSCEFLIAVFPFCLFPLARLRTRRLAYYFGLGIGLAVYAPHLLFFWTIFGGGAIALWYILPFWLGLFVMLGRACLFRFGPAAWACLAPFLWTGLEFFRSELYYLRFSWLNAGLCLFGFRRAALSLRLRRVRHRILVHGGGGRGPSAGPRAVDRIGVVDSGGALSRLDPASKRFAAKDPAGGGGANGVLRFRHRGLRPE
jgi:hypothetical protein